MRLLFRVLLAVTLVVMFLGRLAGGRLFSPVFTGLFLQWFAVSVFVFAVFGLRAAYLAWRDAPNRRAYMFDIILAAAWVPYWYTNLTK
jgi:hypothetical protein